MSDIVKDAENVIKSLSRNKADKFNLRTNQIRKFLSAVNTINNKVNVYQAKAASGKVPGAKSDVLPPYIVAEIKYLKIKIAYQAGRERAVKDFTDKAKLTAYIDDIGSDVHKYKTFAKYIEALVAYHKFYGGQD